MSRFVILTGSETKPIAWNNFRRLIEAYGYQSAVFGLEDVSWESGFDSAVSTLAQKIGVTSQTILVGHSIAGLVLPVFGDRLGAISEIYVAAFTPKDGQSLLDRLILGEEIFDTHWSEGYQSLIRSKSPLETHRHFLDHHLFHDCVANAADLYWKKSELPLEAIYGSLYPPEFRPRHRHYVVCSADRTISADWQRYAASLLPNPTVTEIDSGHCPHISKPRELAQQIIKNISNAETRPSGIPQPS